MSRTAPAHVGGRILAARTDRGWSQADLAARLGVARARVSAVERGVEVPSLEWLGRVATALGVPPSALDPRLADR